MTPDQCSTTAADARPSTNFHPLLDLEATLGHPLFGPIFELACGCLQLPEATRDDPIGIHLGHLILLSLVFPGRTALWRS